MYKPPAERRAAIESALAKPIAPSYQEMDVSCFDPWEDVIQGIYGGYSSESDNLFIDALEAVRDGKTFEFMKRRDFAGELALYVLAGHGLTEYGTSPRGGWPDPSVKDLWQPLIDKWKAHADMMWHGEWR